MWIFFAVSAAFVQNLRFMLQKHLTSTGLSSAGSTFARFVWSAPFVLAGLYGLLQYKGQALPPLPAKFFAFAMLGGVTQVLATVFMVMLFSRRNFAVGATFKKTETLQAAIIGVVLIGDHLTPMGWVVLFIGLIGVVMLSADAVGGSWNIASRSTALGLGAGLLFGFCAVCYRGATLSLGLDDFVLRAIISLAFVVSFQAFILAAYLKYREPGQILRVLKGWRVTGLVGLSGMIGSICWFCAFSLQNAAYVNMVGQVELIFAAIGSYFVFNERLTMREGLGIILITMSILLLIATL